MAVWCHPERSEGAGTQIALPDDWRSDSRDNARTSLTGHGARLSRLAIGRAGGAACEHIIDPNRGVVGRGRLSQPQRRAAGATACAPGIEAGLRRPASARVQRIAQPAPESRGRNRTVAVGDSGSARGPEEKKGDQTESSGQSRTARREAAAGGNQAEPARTRRDRGLVLPLAAAACYLVKWKSASCEVPSLNLRTSLRQLLAQVFSVFQMYLYCPEATS
jgi:hypothetical protein